MKLRHKILTAIFLISVFLIIPIFGTGAMWIRHVALLPGASVVFSSDAAAMDRFMAAALKPYYGDRIGICDGVNDHVEIQAALNAVRDVKLSVGQFNCEVAIDILNSDQTLRGCGRNTILTTSTADLVFLSAVGGAGSELTGIVIADLQIDGGAGGVSDAGIYFEYVDYSFIENVYSRRHASGTGSYRTGICLKNSDSNVLLGNTCQGNGQGGISLFSSSDNTISGNTLTENSQDTTNTHDDIYLQDSDYNNIQGNTCRAGALAAVPRYGINIFNAACDGNLVTNNDIHDDGFGTGTFNDTGTGTVTVAGNRV